MFIEFLLAGIIVNQEINAFDKNIKGKIKNLQNRLNILQEKVNNDLLMYENQKLEEKLEQLKNNKEFS